MTQFTTALNDPAIFSRSFQGRRQDGPCKDPCDYIMKYGGEAFQMIIAKAKHAIDYKFEDLVAKVLRADPNAHSQAIEDAVAWFATWIATRIDLEPDHPALITPYKKGAIVSRLSRLSGLSVEEVRRLIDRDIAWQRKLRQPKHLKLAELPMLDDPKRDKVLDQLDALEEQ